MPLDYSRATYTTYNSVLEALTPAVEARRTAYRNIGAYAEFLVPIKNKIQFTLGSRYDINNQYGNVFTPRFGIVGLPSNNLTMKLLYGEAFRAPTAREMYSTGFGLNARISNPDLKPERMKSYEGSIIYNIIKIGTVELDGFTNYATDVIFSNVDNGKGNIQNINMGKMKIYGLDLKLMTQPIKKLYVFGTMSYQSGEQTILAKKDTVVFDPIIVDSVFTEYTVSIPNIAKIKWNFGFDYHIFKQLNVSFMLNSVGERSTIYTNPFRKVDGYMLANMNITGEITKNISLSLKITNLFNAENYDPGVRLADEASYLTRIEQPGRAIYIKIGFKL